MVDVHVHALRVEYGREIFLGRFGTDDVHVGLKALAKARFIVAEAVAHGL